MLLTGRDEGSLGALASSLESLCHVEIFAIDLRDKKGRGRLEELICERSVDLLINNAGLGFWGKLWGSVDDEVQAMIDVNIEALVFLTKRAVSMWKERGRRGRVLNISSVASLTPMPSEAVYGATKAFVSSFSKAVDFECRKLGIRVLAAAPVPIETHFSSRASKGRAQGVGSGSLSAERAARLIVGQLERGKGFEITGFKMKLSFFLARHLLPEKLLLSIIGANIEKRL